MFCLSKDFFHIYIVISIDFHGSNAKKSSIAGGIVQKFFSVNRTNKT